MHRVRSVLVAAALLALLPGCTKKLTLPVDGPAAAYRNANETLGSGPSIITLTDGQSVSWHGVQIAPDLTTGIPLAGARTTAGAVGDRPELKTNFIAQIEARSRSRGALHGVLFGVVGGAIMGLVGDPDALCEPEETQCNISRGEAVGTLSLGGAFIGAAIGAFVTARTQILIR